MATYKQIQTYVEENFGYTPKTCWIADVKNQCGLTTKIAHNRQNLNKRVHPCPPNRKQDIENALRHFEMI